MRDKITSMSNDDARDWINSSFLYNPDITLTDEEKAALIRANRSLKAWDTISYDIMAHEDIWSIDELLELIETYRTRIDGWREV